MQGCQESVFTPQVFRFYRIRSVVDEDSLFRVRQLWLTVLQHALQAYKRGPSTDPEFQEEYEDICTWLRSEEADYLGGFQSICGLLDIDPQKILTHLDEISEEGLRGLRKTGLDDVQ